MIDAQKVVEAHMVAQGKAVPRKQEEQAQVEFARAPAVGRPQQTGQRPPAIQGGTR